MQMLRFKTILILFPVIFILLPGAANAQLKKEGPFTQFTNRLQ